MEDESNYFGNSERFPLHAAITEGRDSEALNLIGRKGNLDTKDDNEETPLMIAVTKGNLRVTGGLLDAGADPNVRDDDGFTALMLAAIGNPLESINTMPEINRTPQPREHWEWDAIATLLLRKGADTWITNRSGERAIDIAIAGRRLSVEKILREHSKQPIR